MLYDNTIKNGIIHVHSEYSVKDSAMSIATLLKTASALGAPAVVLTDHGVLSGTYPLINTAKDLAAKEIINPIKVIPGVEAYVEGDGKITRNMHLVLIPCDYQGYKAISKAVTQSNKNLETSTSIPRMTTEILKEWFGEGSLGHGHVIACSACIAGVLSQILIQNNKINKEIEYLKKKLDSPNNPKSPENAKALKKCEEIEAQIDALKEKKASISEAAKKSLFRLEKTAASLKGKEGYSAAVKALNDATAQKEEANRQLAKVNSQIASLVAEKKPLTAIRTKLKGTAEAFEEHEKNIRILSSRIKSDATLLEEAKKAALMYNTVFGDGNFYVEIQYHGIPAEAEIMPRLVFLANELNLPMVATNDAHYATNNPDDELARRINMSQRFKIWQQRQTGDDQLYIKTDKELAEALSSITSVQNVEKAMSGIKSIIDRCNVVFPKETHYPKFNPPEGYTSKEYLRKLALEGIPKRFKASEWTKEHQERLDYELETIHNMGFDDYHLIVQDFLNYTREKAKDPETGIGVGVGPGRGSAVGSLVCYLIGITDINPMRHGLLFERYLNPERVTMPDIDSDFANYIRPDAFEYVRKKYGENGVCMIETNSSQPPRAAIKAVGRVYGGKEYSSVADRISSDITAKDNTHFSATNESGKTLKERLLAKFPDSISKEIINMASLIDGSLINYGTHAAGVVIGDNGDISDYIPLKANKGNDGWVCQCTKEDVEGCAGLLKFDFLGLINLDIENRCIQDVYRKYGKKINLSTIPFEREVFKNIFAAGKTNAVFQFESEGMKSMLKEFKPDCIEDIILLVAAYRPGPMQYLPEIKAVKSGEKKAEYIFPEIAEILDATYGKPVYQEQIQAIFHRFAGCSLGEADIIRRIMSKKKVEMLTDPRTNYKGRFIDGMIAHGAKPKAAEDFWNELLSFAKYAFNKSHAAAYAYLAYQTAWLKYHYPAEYMSAVLYCAKVERYPKIINEARCMGVTILPPSVKYSDVDFTSQKNVISFGIGNVKGAGNCGTAIIEERKKKPFTSFKDFLKRVSLKQNQLTALIEAGVFDEFNPNRSSLKAGSETICDILKSLNNKKEALALLYKKKSELDKGDEKEEKALERKIHNLQNAVDKYEKMIDYFAFNDCLENFAERLEKEKDLLGYYVSGHPMDGWEIPNGVTYISEIDEGKDISIAGIISNFKELYRKSDGASFAKFTVEDKSGTIDVMCWHASYTPANANKIKDRAAVKLFGKCVSEKEDDDGNKIYSFVMSEITELKKNVSFEQMAKEKAESYFNKQLSVVIPSLLDWVRLKDRFKEYEDDAGAILTVCINGYRQAQLGYKVSANILYADLGVSFTT